MTTEPSLEDARTRPWYWIAIEGADVWNRWARGDFSRKEWEKRLEKIKDTHSMARPDQERAIKKWETFWELDVEPLTNEERAKIIANIIKHCDIYQDITELPSPEESIDFSYTTWRITSISKARKPLHNFERFIFPSAFYCRRSTFNWEMAFQQALFLEHVSFHQARFKSQVQFNSCIFLETADYTETTFENRVDYCHAQFLQGVNFAKATFHDKGLFIGTRFSSLLWCEYTHFKDHVRFDRTLFEGNSHFNHSTFDHGINFKAAQFPHSVPQFYSAKLSGALNFTKTKIWPDRPRMRHDDDIILSYSVLRKQMEELKFHDLALFFHRKELEAKRYAADTPTLKRWILGGFHIFSGFGHSVKRPTISLALAFVLFFFVYGISFLALQTGSADFGAAVSRALYAAWHYTLPLLPTDKNTHNAMLNIHELCGDGAHGCILTFSLMRSLHSIFSLLCLFLIGLGIRNLLRMK